MARKTLVELIDDLDGSPADETVSFSVDGVQYEIDVNKKNAKKLRADIGKWTERGRRTGGRRARASSGGRSASRSDLAAVREWANANGYKVSDRGRVSQAILEAYDNR